MGPGSLPGCPPTRCPTPYPFIATSSQGFPDPELLGSTGPEAPACVSALHTPGWPRSQVPKCVQVSCLQTSCRVEVMAIHPQLTPAKQCFTVCNVLSETQSHLNPCTRTSEGGRILPLVQNKKLRLKEAQCDFCITWTQSSSTRSGTLLLFHSGSGPWPAPARGGKGPWIDGSGHAHPITYWGVT